MSTQDVQIENTDELSSSGELYRIEESRNDDGTVDATVINWQKDGDDVEVEFQLPTGDTDTETMQWPWPLDDELESYKFVRLCEHVGGVTMADELREGHTTVPANFEGSRNTGSWELVVPKDRSLVERFTDRFVKYPSSNTLFRLVGSALFSPLLVPLFILMIIDPSEPGDTLDEHDVEIALHSTGISLGILSWCLIYFVVL